MEVMFKLNPPPKKTLQDGRTLRTQEEEEQGDDQEQEEGEGEAGQGEIGVSVGDRQVSTESKGDQDNDDDDDDDPIDYTNAPASSSQSNPTAPSQTVQSNPSGHVLFRLGTEGDSDAEDSVVSQEVLVDPSTVFDKESLEDITSFFVKSAGGKQGHLSYAKLRNWEDVQAMFENGLITEEALQRAWREVARGAATIGYDGFLQLNVRLERLMDEVEAQGSGSHQLTPPRGRRSRPPSLETLPPLAHLQLQSQLQSAVGSLQPSSQTDGGSHRGVGVGVPSSGATRLDTLQPQMATEEQKQHKVRMISSHT